MSPIAVSGFVLACVFGGAILGMLLRGFLPDHHLTSETKDIVKLGTGLIGTMAALLLGLLVASTKSAYDADKLELTQLSAKIIFLDRLLVNYGPEANDSRQYLQSIVATMLTRIWPEDSTASSQFDPSAANDEPVYSKIQQLEPHNDMQRLLKQDALDIAIEIGKARWLLREEMESSLSLPFLIMVVFWIAVIFVSFGLFAPRNVTVFITLLICAFSVAGAIFLILELDQPFSGMLQISSAPMRDALVQLQK